MPAALALLSNATSERYWRTHCMMVRPSSLAFHRSKLCAPMLTSINYRFVVFGFLGVLAIGGFIAFGISAFLPKTDAPLATSATGASARDDDPDNQFGKSAPVAPVVRKAERESTLDEVNDFLKAENAYKSGDYTTALQQFRSLADRLPSDADVGAKSRLFLGMMYREGKGVPQNYAEALRWFGISAATCNSLAQLTLGAMYFGGEGVPQQDEAAAINQYISK